MTAGFDFFSAMSSDPAVLFLPTLEKLRAAPLFDVKLPDGEPQQIEKLAMLVVQAALVRRTSWTEEVSNAPGYLQRGEPPPPVDDQPRHHVRIDERLEGGTCLACTERPGLRRCRVCGGRGRIMNDTWVCSCNAGWVPCANCGGRVQMERVRLRYYSDVPAFLNEAYMPTHIAQNGALFGLETHMEQELNMVSTPPEALRCHDLTGEVTGTAYRGGNRKIRPNFHGHDFGDAIDLALAGLSAAGAGAKVERYQVRAYAWPFLRLQWSDERDWAIYADRSGSICIFQGRRSWE